MGTELGQPGKGDFPGAYGLVHHGEAERLKLPNAPQLLPLPPADHPVVELKQDLGHLAQGPEERARLARIQLHPLRVDLQDVDPTVVQLPPAGC